MSGRTFVVSVYGLGALVDGLAVVPMLLPGLGGVLYGVDVSAFGPEYRFAMSMGAALMAGWTGLLVWGALAPIERRGVLLLTAVPVVTGLWASNAYAVLAELAPFAMVAPMLVFQALIFGLMIAAWAVAGRIERA